MPGSTPPTSQLDWLISTTAMIVLFWSRATRDLLKSFGWGIATLHRLIQRRSCHPRRPPHSISPLEEKRFELPVPLAAGSLLLRFEDAAGGKSDRRLAAKFLDKKISVTTQHCQYLCPLH